MTHLDHPQEQTAIRTDLGAIFVSLELSRAKWLITSLSSGGGETMSKHTVAGGDVAGLFEQLRAKARARTGRTFRIIVIQEAGLDGFWIHRVLEAEGIESHVVDAASGENRDTRSSSVNRRARRARGRRWRPGRRLRRPGPMSPPIKPTVVFTFYFLSPSFAAHGVSPGSPGPTHFVTFWALSHLLHKTENADRLRDEAAVQFLMEEL